MKNEEYRRLKNPAKAKGIFTVSDQNKFNYRPPQINDIVSVTTTGKIYIQVLIESMNRDIIRGEIVGIGPVAAPIVGTINQDKWELLDKIEIEHSWIDAITYHEAKPD